MIPIYKPYLANLKYAHDALDSSWISSTGKYKELVAEELKRLSGFKYVVLTSNGTTAMYLVAKSLRFRYPELKNLVVPDNVYVAAINPFLFEEEYRLSVAHTDDRTWNMDSDLPSGDAVLVVHNLGNIINVPELKRRYPNRIFVEDNCEGFLGEYEGKPSGSESFCSAVSFYGNKIISSGEGGAFFTNDKEVYEYAYSLHAQGESSKKFVHDILGYNLRMTNVEAAILYGQIKDLDNILEMKERVFDKYRSELGHLSQGIEPNTKHANWMFGVRIKGSSYEIANEYFKKHHIETRPMFYPLMAHKHIPIYGCSITEMLLPKECIILPSYPELSNEDLTHIIRTVKNYADRWS